MDKNIGISISKNLSGKYNKKILDHAKNSPGDALKTSPKRVIQKTAEGTGNLNGNKIMGVSKNLQQNNSEAVTSEHDNKEPKEPYLSIYLSIYL